MARTVEHISTKNIFRHLSDPEALESLHPGERNSAKLMDTMSASLNTLVMNKYRLDQALVKNLTRKELDNLIAQILAENLLTRSDLGILYQKCQASEAKVKKCEEHAKSLQKQCTALKDMIKKYAAEAEDGQAVAPTKSTRSVGLQINIETKSQADIPTASRDKLLVSRKEALSSNTTPHLSKPTSSSEMLSKNATQTLSQSPLIGWNKLKTSHAAYSVKSSREMLITSANLLKANMLLEDREEGQETLKKKQTQVVGPYHQEGPVPGPSSREKPTPDTSRDLVPVTTSAPMEQTQAPPTMPAWPQPFPGVYGMPPGPHPSMFGWPIYYMYPPQGPRFVQLPTGPTPSAQVTTTTKKKPTVVAMPTFSAGTMFDSKRGDRFVVYPEEEERRSLSRRRSPFRRRSSSRMRPEHGRSPSRRRSDSRYDRRRASPERHHRTRRYYYPKDCSTCSERCPERHERRRRRERDDYRRRRH